MLNNWIKGYEGYFYFVFRVFVGLLFMQHGVQKLFGWFGGNSVNLTSLMGLAGVIETFAGLAIVLGLLTRWAALISALEMAIAYFMAHFPNGWVPLKNGGELALLFFAAFLVIIAEGSKKWSLDKIVFK
ncbi:DoxX family protein [Candidatus Woesearchaeota archaeon]|nr:DoxX family protein [Candidatus Woesearchaeota archaeon]